MAQIFPWIPSLSADAVSLGDGYNAWTGEVVPQQIRRSSATSARTPSATVSYDTVLTADGVDACTKISAGAEVKLAVLCGLIEPSGAMAFAKPTPPTAFRQKSFSIVATVTSTLEKLGVEGPEDWDEAAMRRLYRDKAITHVVGCVRWGLRATLTGLYVLSDEETESDVEEMIATVADRCRSILVSGRGNLLPFSGAQWRFISCLRMSVECDNNKLVELPQEFEGILGVFKRLVTDFASGANHRVVALQIYPVEYILRTTNAPQPSTRCCDAFATVVGRCLERFRRLRNMQADLTATSRRFTPYGAAFPETKKKLARAAALLQQEAVEFTSRLRETLLAVQKAGSNDGATAIVEACEQEVHFRWAAGRRFVTILDKECRWFASVVRMLTPTIEQPFEDRARHADPTLVASTVSRLSLTLGNDVCSGAHPFLDDPVDGDYDDDTDEWVEDDSKLASVSELLKKFEAFAAHNKRLGTNVFFTAEHIKGKKDAGTYLYRAGGAAKPELFPLPVAPVPVLRESGPSSTVFALPSATGMYKSVTRWSVDLISSHGSDRRSVAAAPTSETLIRVDDLPSLASFEVRAAGITDAGTTPWSADALLFQTPKAPGACCAIAHECPHVGRTFGKKPRFYQLPLKVVKELVDTRNRQTPPPQQNSVVAQPDGPMRRVVWKTVEVFRGAATIAAKDLVVLLIGQTGVGKTTQVNAMVNWFLGVEFACPHRFVLAEEPPNASAQGQAVTQEITVYTIPCFRGCRLKRTLHIIDPPGCNDTRGTDYDRAIVDMFAMLYREQPVLHCIAFLALAGQPRLTGDQLYVITEVTKVFGNGVRNNFVGIFTKSDGGQLPTELCAELVSKGVNLPVDRRIRTNNISFAMNPEEGLSAEGSFKTSIDSNAVLFKVCSAFEAVTTEESKTVVERRQDLIEVLDAMDLALNDALSTLDELLADFKIIKDADPREPKKKECKKQKGEKIPITHCTTLCYKCFHTCHEVCTLEPTAPKDDCAAMENGRCKVCPGKCLPSEHKNDNFKVVYRETMELVDDDELVKKYAEGVAAHVQKEGAIAALLRKYVRQMDQVNEYVVSMHKTHSELNRIALNKMSLTPRGYIEKLRDKVLQDKYPGYQQKAAQLDSLIRQQEQFERFKQVGGVAHQDEVAELKAYLDDAAEELERMTRLTFASFATVRNASKPYRWCSAPCTWNEALLEMMALLEDMLNVANGRPSCRQQSGQHQAKRCSLM